MNLGLNGRVAIVTGGNRGIGKAVAKLLVREGAKVVICARGRQSLNAAKREISRRDNSVMVVAADATKPKEVHDVLHATFKKFGKLDILVNNVGGVSKFGNFLELEDSDWIEAFNLNIMSVVYFVRYALPLLKQSRSARIINISSISGVQPGFYNPHYTAVKAAVINLSKYFANQFASDRILVNVVCAGPVHSNSWDRNIQHIADRRNISIEEARAKVEIERASKIPLGRVGEGEDIAGLTVFLASDKASWITGSCFHVNGGELHSMY